MKTLFIHRAVFFTVCLLTYSVHLAEAQQPSNRLAKTLSVLIEAREMTAGNVMDIKKGFKENSEEYIEARRLYRIAQSKQRSWVTAVKTAIREGESNQIEKDPLYDGLAKETIKASQDFLNFVDKTTGQQKGINALIPGLVDAGVKIWKEVYSEVKETREKYADNFERDALWARWEDIK